MPARFAYSVNGENYTGTFATRDQALAAGLQAARESLDAPQSVFVGRRVEPDPHAAGHARSVLREMAWQAHDEVGAPAASYLIQLPDAAVRDLDLELEKVLVEWLRRHDLLPKYFKVDSISEHPVPLPASTGSSANEPKGPREVTQSLGQS